MAKEPVKESCLFNNGLCFIENKGYVKDQYGKSRNDIDFKVSGGGGLNVFIGRRGIHYQWSKEALAQPSPKEGEVLPRHCLDLAEPKRNVDMYRMDVELVGANINAEFVTEDEQTYTEHYYTSPFNPDRGGTMHSYKKVTYKNVYPGIDWVLYVGSKSSYAQSAFAGKATADEGGECLEYDFVVHEGGNVRDIRLKYSGDTILTLNEDGSLFAATAIGVIKEQKPYSYEVNGAKGIKSKFVLEGDMLSFKVAHYDGTLIIDPMLDWATYFGGSGDEYSREKCTFDNKGNIYWVGYTSSTSNIATTGAYHVNYGGGPLDAFMAKFSSTGSLLWATYYGGDSSEYALGISSDKWGSVYLGGTTKSLTNIATAGAYQASNAGWLDFFLARFDTAGILHWATYYGGNNPEIGGELVCDSSHNIYISGSTSSGTGIASPGAYQTSYGGGLEDACLAKFDSSGSLLWGTYYGSDSNDQAVCIAYDAITDHIYLAGLSYGLNNIASNGAWQTSNGGLNDGFLVKFSPSGSRTWGTYYGGSGDDACEGVSCDKEGNVYIVGGTLSSNGMASLGAFQGSYGGNHDGFVAKFNSSGTRLWGTYYGGSGLDECSSVACDTNGYVYVTGFSNSTSGIAGLQAYQQTYGGGSADVFLVKFSSSGAWWWGSYYGGTGSDGYGGTAEGIACDKECNIYVNSYTNSNNGIATPGAYQSNCGGNYDAFLAKFLPDSLGIGQPYTDTVFCRGDTFNVACNTNFIYTFTNVFTVQLSDSNGNFTNAASIGSTNDSVSCNITCIVPNTAHGIGYRIRIVASSPADTSRDEGVNILIQIPFTPMVSISSNPVVPVVGQADTFTAIGNCAGNAVYQWYNKAVPIAGATNNLYTGTAAAGDSIYVVMYCNSNCASIDSAISNVIGLPVSVNNKQLTVNSIRIYPNPASSVLYVETSPGLPKGEVTVNVLSIEGKLLLDCIVPRNDPKGINISGLPAGLYLIKVFDEKTILLKTERMVKVAW